MRGQKFQVTKADKGFIVETFMMDLGSGEAVDSKVTATADASAVSGLLNEWLTGKADSE